MYAITYFEIENINEEYIKTVSLVSNLHKTTCVNNASNEEPTRERGRIKKRSTRAQSRLSV